MKIEQAPTKMWTRLRTDWFILTADFWLDETLFPRVKKSFRDCNWMKKFPYAFFMRSILSENLRRYEINDGPFYFWIRVPHWVRCKELRTSLQETAWAWSTSKHLIDGSEKGFCWLNFEFHHVRMLLKGAVSCEIAQVSSHPTRTRICCSLEKSSIKGDNGPLQIKLSVAMLSM